MQFLCILLGKRKMMGKKKGRKKVCKVTSLGSHLKMWVYFGGIWI